MERGGEEGQGQSGIELNGMEWNGISPSSETDTRSKKVESHCIQPISRGRNKMNENEWEINVIGCGLKLKPNRSILRALRGAVFKFHLSEGH